MTVKNNRLYELNDFPPLHKSAALGFQHILAMFVGNASVALIVATSIGITMGETALWLQCAMFASGVTTVVQAFGLGPVGARLPMVMGLSFTFVAPSVSIATEYGLAILFGSIIVGGIVEAIFGTYIIKRFWKYFPSVVTGPVILTIGIVLFGKRLRYEAYTQKHSARSEEIRHRYPRRQVPL